MRHVLIAACIVAACGTAAAQDHEQKIQRSDLPSAVEASLQREINGAKILGLSKELEKGNLYYEAECIVDGHSKDILFAENGQVEEVEEQVAFEALPTNVQQSLRHKAEPGRITKIESLTKHGQLVAYEAQVRTNGKRSEIQVGPDGQKLAHEE
jgi:hypothetical protein